MKNHKSVRGSKGIIDKSDVAVILSKVTYDELEMLKKIIEECGIEPNQVTDLYKNRRGRYVDIRIWSRVDLGTCRKQDLFVTDSRYQMIHGFFYQLLDLYSEFYFLHHISQNRIKFFCFSVIKHKNNSSIYICYTILGISRNFY